MGRGRGPGRAPVTGKFRSLKPSDKRAPKRPSKRAVDTVTQSDGHYLARLASGGKGIMTQGGPLQIVSRDAPLSPSNFVSRKRVRRDADQQGVDVNEDAAGTSTRDSLEGERPPFLVDFQYPGGEMLCCDGDACARLASQLVMTEYPFPPVDRLAFKDDYKIMLKSVFRGLGRTNFLVSNYEELVSYLEAQNSALTDEKVELAKDVDQLRNVSAEITAALEVAEEKCSLLSQKCGYHPDNVLLGDESLGGWKSRSTLTAELEASRQELRRYQDFEAVVASYLADRDMSADAVSLLSEKLGELQVIAKLKVDGTLALPEHYEAAKADFERQRALTANLEVAQLDVEDLLSDKARDYVLARRAEQERVRNSVGEDSAERSEHVTAAGSGEEQPLRTDAMDLRGEQSAGHAGDVNPDGEDRAPETDIE